MLHARVVAVGVVASLMLVANALALGIVQETPAQIEAFSILAQKIDLADAVASAESGMRGKVVCIHFVEPEGHLVYPNYAAVLLSDGKLVSVNVDPMTGIASMPMTMDARSATAFDQEQRVAETLKRPRSSLQQAIDVAQRYADGKAIDAWLTEQQGKPVYAIGIVKAKQVRIVTVDPMNDNVDWQAHAMTQDGATAPNSGIPGYGALARLDPREGTGQ